jgi:hypothetical protein
MKKRLHDKKAGIAILAALIIISIAEVVLRGVFFRETMFDLSNAGEPFITALFSLMLIIFALKGKDRVFYILCGAWIGCFVLNQLLDLPSMVATLVRCITTANIFGIIAAIAHLLSIFSIVSIGALLVEYMNDGTIYNKAFNILCVVTVVLQAFLLLHTLHSTFNYGNTYVILAALHELSRLILVFLFAFFAYDSAKLQLKQANLTK